MQKKYCVLFTDLNLSSPILRAIDEMGYINPTPIQQQAFSVIRSGRDVVGVAQTGTGKTLAYLLPLLTHLNYSEQRHPRILVLVPTRELVVQVEQEAKQAAKYTSLRIAGVYGGTNMTPQAETVMEGLDVLIGTPGRLFDLAMRGVLSVKQIKHLVIDEVDEMLNLGFLPQVKSMIDLVPERRQNIVFSATLSEQVEKLLSGFLGDTHKIEIAPHGTPLDQIEQRVFLVPNFYTKINLLAYLCNTEPDFSKVLVFVPSKKIADLVYEKLQPQFPEKIGVIHGNKSQNYRFNTLEKFEKEEINLLVSTDIMARGLDITDVSHVINMNIPENPGDYLHRIGRTGRIHKAGISISFTDKSELEYLQQAEQLMKKSLLIKELPAEVEVAELLLPEEEPSVSTKNYIKAPRLKSSKGAFHEKKQKNKKVNLGGPGRKRVDKPSNRGAQKRKNKK